VGIASGLAIDKHLKVACFDVGSPGPRWASPESQQGNQKQPGLDSREMA